jgi:hypothetical protein
MWAPALGRELRLSTQLWPAVQSIPVEIAYCVTSRRNDSLGSRGRWRIFAALCTASAGLALAFAAERETVTKDLRHALAVR